MNTAWASLVSDVFAVVASGSGWLSSWRKAPKVCWPYSRFLFWWHSIWQAANAPLASYPGSLGMRLMLHAHGIFTLCAKKPKHARAQWSNTNDRGRWELWSSSRRLWHGHSTGLGCNLRPYRDWGEGSWVPIQGADLEMLKRGCW